MNLQWFSRTLRTPFRDAQGQLGSCSRSVRPAPALTPNSSLSHYSLLRNRLITVSIRNYAIHGDLREKEDSLASRRTSNFLDDRNELETFLAAAEEHFGISNTDEWYEVKNSEIEKYRGMKSLISSRGSLSAALKEAYPDVVWYPWLFDAKVPKNFWKDPENQRAYMRWLSNVLKRKEGDPESWYSIKTEDFLSNHGATILLNIYNSSPFLLLSKLYPEKDWLAWRFESTPRGFWNDKGNQRKFFDWLSTQLGYLSPEHWYNLTNSILIEKGGERLLSKFGSVPKFVSAMMPGYEFLPWLFSTVPYDFWKDLNNRRRYIEWLKSKLNISANSEIRGTHFRENHGAGLLNSYNGSPDAVLQSLTGSDSQPIAEIPRGVKNYFDSFDLQKGFAESLAKKLGFDPNDEEKWYDLEMADFGMKGKWLLQKHFKSSPYLFLKTVYPSVDWKPWKFRKLSKAISDDAESIKRIIRYIESELDLKTKEDWNRVSETQLKDLKVLLLFKKLGGKDAVIQRFRD